MTADLRESPESQHTEPKRTVDRATYEALGDEIRAYLGQEIYASSRSYEAWKYGTMSLDDFSLASEDEDIVTSLIEIALEKLGFETEPKTESKDN